MAVLTTADKAYRRRLPALAVVTLVIEALRWIKVLKANQPTPVWRIAGDDVACEPTRKDRCLDPPRWPLRISGINRWRPQLRRAISDQPSVILQALMQQPSGQYDEPTVTQLLQKGYELQGRTLRPAQVAVSKIG